MYSYKKSKKAMRRNLLVSLSALMVASVGYFSYEYLSRSSAPDQPVFKEDSVPVLQLPDTGAEMGMKPFKVGAQSVLEYFDGNENTIENVVKFEGVYRGNQGIDYAFENQAFDVLASFSGEVLEVKDDPLFGKSVAIGNGDLIVTYQSISEVSLKQGDQVKQGDIVGKAGVNIYNKDLGNHLHLVVTKAQKIIDPKKIFGKAIAEIK